MAAATTAVNRFLLPKIYVVLCFARFSAYFYRLAARYQSVAQRLAWRYTPLSISVLRRSDVLRRQFLVVCG